MIVQQYLSYLSIAKQQFILWSTHSKQAAVYNLLLSTLNRVILLLNLVKIGGSTKSYKRKLIQKIINKNFFTSKCGINLYSGLNYIQQNMVYVAGTFSFA